MDESETEKNGANDNGKDTCARNQRSNDVSPKFIHVCNIGFISHANYLLDSVINFGKVFILLSSCCLIRSIFCLKF